MTREQFAVLAKAMKAVYAQATFLPDQNAFNVWYEMLKDLPYELAQLSIQKHMMTEKFPPTIADIRAGVRNIKARPEEDMSELEAWSLVYKAICRSAYYSEEEFEKLPEACRIAVGNPANLKEWSLMNTDQVETVGQSHFIRNYRTAVQRLKDKAKLPEKMLQTIEQKRQEFLSLEGAGKQVPRIEEERNEFENKAVPIPDHIKERIGKMFGKGRAV